MRILVVENSRRAPAGLFGACMAERGVDTVLVSPAEGEPLPAGADGYDGALVLGGPQSAADDGSSSYLAGLLGLIRDFAAAGRPVLGICLGAQLLARAFGKPVYQHRVPERGYRPVQATAAGMDDPLLGGLGAERCLMQWHYDTFELPDEAVLLATGAECDNQAFRIGDHLYGLQFHPEVTPEIVRDWIALFRDRAEPGEDYDALVRTVEAGMAEHFDQAADFARGLAHRWLDRVEALARQRG